MPSPWEAVAKRCAGIARSCPAVAAVPSTPSVEATLIETLRAFARVLLGIP